MWRYSANKPCPTTQKNSALLSIVYPTNRQLENNGLHSQIETVGRLVQPVFLALMQLTNSWIRAQRSGHSSRGRWFRKCLKRFFCASNWIIINLRRTCKVAITPAIKNKNFTCLAPAFYYFKINVPQMFVSQRVWMRHVIGRDFGSSHLFRRSHTGNYDKVANYCHPSSCSMFMDDNPNMQ